LAPADFGARARRTVADRRPDRLLPRRGDAGGVRAGGGGGLSASAAPLRIGCGGRP
jgi:hypothetical protein